MKASSSLTSAQAGTRGISYVPGRLGDEYVRLQALLRAYQIQGHVIAETDPLQLPHEVPYVTAPRAKEVENIRKSELFSLKSYGASEEMFQKANFAPGLLAETTGFTGLMGVGEDELPPAEHARHFANVATRAECEDAASKWSMLDAVRRAEEVYTGPIGFEFMHVSDREKCNFLRSFIETSRPFRYADETRKNILTSTARAQLFEEFLASKFSTAKRFGVDGCEGLLPGLNTMTRVAGILGAKSIIIGMAHRGRLNVLTNVLKKDMDTVLREFQGLTGFGAWDWGNLGDVKYHLGTENKVVDEQTGKELLMTLLANPSHLEAVDGVLLGQTRARQMLKYGGDENSVIPVMLHGDAAVAGQGIVFETLQMSQLPNYRCGGCIHVVINNQVGFTTNVVDGGSGKYCTDVAKSVDAPVFHVDSSNPEHVAFAFELAVRYRQKFNSDVFVDLIGYRKFGHNELDMPKFTQPLMYARIDKQKSILERYSQRLISEGVVSQAEYDNIVKNILAEYNTTLQETRKDKKPTGPLRALSPEWQKLNKPFEISKAKATGVACAELTAIGEAISVLPNHIKPHPNITKIYQGRAEAVKNTTKPLVDYGFAEALAFTTLLKEGFNVRLGGEDVERGTFSHRHAVVNGLDGQRYSPMQNFVSQNKLSSKLEISNSLLSEYAAMGFEYGFGLESPSILPIWEGQFGDFCNTAQVVIDQFISSGEIKWNQMSALTLLLPHGYDGQGPEHSSARIERFLELCDDREDLIHKSVWDESLKQSIQKHSMQVVNCSTPANFFHVLRRQMHRDFRKPLVVFSPKRLLRMKQAMSCLADMQGNSQFQPLIRDTAVTKTPESISKVKRMVLVSGQLYYDIVAKRKAANKESEIAIARVEQLSPFPTAELVKHMQELPNIESVVWAQEEPMNMGAWSYVNPRVQTALAYLGDKTKCKSKKPIYAGRDVCGSPAVGCAKLHAAQLDRLIADCLDVNRTLNSFAEKYS